MVDAAIISSLADGVVLVVKAFSTPRPSIIQAIRQLSEINANIFGCVLNDVNFEKESYHYSSYQYYHNYYYYSDEEGRKSGVRNQKLL